MSDWIYVDIRAHDLSPLPLALSSVHALILREFTFPNPVLSEHVS
jgi:hypothetical protein